MKHTYYVPRHFSPRYSLLGRWLQHRLGDERRAEAFLLLLLMGGALVLVLAQYIAWVFVKPAVLANPRGVVAVVFWISQLVGWSVFLLGAVVGFSPPIVLKQGPEALDLQRGNTRHQVAYASVQAVAVLSAKEFHQHWRRYAQTKAFVNRPNAALVLLKTTAGPVVLGLPAEERPGFVEALEARLPRRARSGQPASSAA